MLFIAVILAFIAPASALALLKTTEIAAITSNQLVPRGFTQSEEMLIIEEFTANPYILYNSRNTTMWNIFSRKVRAKADEWQSHPLEKTKQLPGHVLKWLQLFVSEIFKDAGISLEFIGRFVNHPKQEWIGVKQWFGSIGESFKTVGKMFKENPKIAAANFFGYNSL